jgi:hypothetical protein
VTDANRHILCDREALATLIFSLLGQCFVKPDDLDYISVSSPALCSKSAQVAGLLSE